MSDIKGRLKNAWNVFWGRDPTENIYTSYGISSGYNPSFPRLIRGNSKSVVSSVYNQIAVDCASIDIKHVRLDDEGKFSELIDDELNQALTVSANEDQTGRALIEDLVLSMLDEGVVAVVPFEMDIDPKDTDSWKVLKLRTAKILQWYPKHIQIEIYNEDTGLKEQILIEKRLCAIIENPFYTVMNEPNSTAQRLLRVLSQLDRTNEQNSSGKLDLIVQLPYVIKSEERRKQAIFRRKDLESQLTGSQLGIGYIDGSEKVIQLNRPVENKLWEQAKELTAELYNQLGFSTSIFDGTADEKTMLNYSNRTLEPIMSRVTEEMHRKFLSKTARSQKQAIRFFKDPFKLVPVYQLAEIADKFTRNEIATSNEIRAVIGMKPSSDPKADELRNSNLNHPDEEGTSSTVVEEVVHGVIMQLRNKNIL